MKDQSWRDKAACIGHDPDLWFIAPARDRSGTLLPGADEAVAICEDCPVRQQCFDYIMSFPKTNNYGIWGGTTESQRDRIRDERETA